MNNPGAVATGVGEHMDITTEQTTAPEGLFKNTLGLACRDCGQVPDEAPAKKAGNNHGLTCPVCDTWLCANDGAVKWLPKSFFGLTVESSRTGSFRPKVRAQILARDGGCVLCGVGSHHQGLQADHVIPASSGGPHEAWNGVCLCAQCNMGKGKDDDFDLRLKLWMGASMKKPGSDGMTQLLSHLYSAYLWARDNDQEFYAWLHAIVQIVRGRTING
jgi:hypothetical protein